MRDFHAGPKQKATVVDEVVEVFCPSAVAPADPLVARPYPTGRRAETQHPQDALGAINQVTQLGAAQAKSQRMKGFQQLSALPGSFTLPAAYQNQFHWSDLRQAPTNRRQLQCGLPGGRSPELAGNWIGWLGQVNQAGAFQPLQGDPGVKCLQTARGAPPVQPLAKLARQSPSRQPAPLLADACNHFRTEFPPANNHLTTINQ